jgi:iron complex transport system permease protein
MMSRKMVKNPANNQVAVANGSEMMPEKARGIYGEITSRKYLFLILFAMLLILSFVLDIMTGPAFLSVKDVLRTIFSRSLSPQKMQTIVWTFRMPVALMAMAVGAALGVAGAEMQTIIDNPLASPYTLGVSAAAGFGAALAIVFGVGVLPLGEMFLIPANAFVFAFLCCMLLYFIAKIKRASAEMMVLAGIALLFMFNAMLALMQYLSTSEQVQAIVFWLFGSLMKADWLKFSVTASVLLIVMLLLAADAWELTALRLGDERAKGLGIDVERLRLKTLLKISLLTATAVCFVGTIGFIGLVAPHIARMLVGEDQRFFIPCSAFGGALLLSSASVASKLAFPGEIFPVGITTSLLGIPFFLWLIITKKEEYW